MTFHFIIAFGIFCARVSPFFFFYFHISIYISILYFVLVQQFDCNLHCVESSYRAYVLVFNLRCFHRTLGCD